MTTLDGAKILEGAKSDTSALVMRLLVLLVLGGLGYGGYNAQDYIIERLGYMMSDISDIKREVQQTREEAAAAAERVGQIEQRVNRHDDRLLWMERGRSDRGITDQHYFTLQPGWAPEPASFAPRGAYSVIRPQEANAR